YFNYHSHLLQLARRLEVDALGQYVQRLARVRTSPNGVFGFMAHWEQFDWMQEAEILPYFRALTVIYVERRDRLAQAVSRVRALQTGQWTSRHPIANKPHYERAAIERSIDKLERDIACWEAFFEQSRVRPIRLAYEDFDKAPDTAVNAVLRSFGIERD